MGVADNKTYRDQYHFKDDFRDVGEDYPSINDNRKINQTIKENPYRSNVNIEGGEVVLKPDLTALFKAQGKRHSGGGMDVLLAPESFVFSNFKGIKITDKDKELFELKESKKMTPADVLKENIKVKHYNTLISNLEDPYKDDLAKKSSSMMLEKYIEMLGNIAYIQEEKKGFPDGLPSFSIGTAPVFDDQLEYEIDENKQYMKTGGLVATGGYVDRCPCGKDAKGNCIPCTREQLAQLQRKAARGTRADAQGMNKIGTLDAFDIYHTGTDPKKVNIKPGMSDQQWRDYLKTESPERKKRRLASYGRPGTDNLLAVRNMDPTTYDFPDLDLTLPPMTAPNRPAQIQPNGMPPVDDSITPNPVTGQGQQGIEADWRFTPWQRVSQAHNWLNYAGIQRHMPFRSRYNATYADPALVNEQQAVGNARGIAGNQMASLRSLSPILQSAQSQAITGELLNTIPGLGLQAETTNAGIKNQFRQYNNQIKNNESLVNMANDQQYYQQAVEGRKNFSNARTFAANNAMNNVLRDVETNQKLAYNLLTLNNPAYGYDWRTGNFTRNKMNILDVAGDSKSDFYTQLAGKLMAKMDSGKSLTPEEVGFFKALSIGMKKGGKVKNPYKY